MKINLFLSLLLIGSNLFAQSINTQKLDSLFQILDENSRFMGSIHITHQGKTIYSNSIGFDNLEKSKKSTILTKYRIGSISKMFTSTLIIKAIEQNKIKLDQTIEIWFPKVKNASKITVSNLLNHRSGIYNFTNIPNYLDWNTKPKTRAELLQIIENLDSDFEPNSKASYSNSNYILLTIILEKIHNKPFDDLVKKMTKKLKLKNTYLGLGQKTALDKKECYSYEYKGQWNKSAETDMSVPLGAGAIIAPPSDLTLFIRNLFKGKFISKKSLDLMTQMEDGYGRGLFQFPYGNKKSLGHTGGIDAFSSVLGYFEEDDLAIALCSNGSRYSGNQIILAALDSYYGKTFDLPEFKESTLTSEDLDKYLGIYSNPNIPLKLTITKEGNSLIAQGTNQPSFPLEEKDTHIFEFKMAKVVIEFKPETKELILNQGGQELVFKKE